MFDSEGGLVLLPQKKIKRVLIFALKSAILQKKGDINKMNFIDVVKTILKKNNITQEAFSKNVGWKSSSALRMVVSQNNPTTNTFFEMCEALGYEIVIRNKDNNEDFYIIDELGAIKQNARGKALSQTAEKNKKDPQ